MGDISQNQIDDIQNMFWSETNEEWTQEWRDDLTNEESAIVDKWDAEIDKGLYKLCKAIVELEDKRRTREGSQ